MNLNILYLRWMKNYVTGIFEINLFWLFFLGIEVKKWHIYLFKIVFDHLYKDS